MSSATHQAGTDHDYDDPGPGSGPAGDDGVDVVGEVRRVRQALGALAPLVVPEAIPGHRLVGLDRDLGVIERQVAGMRLVLKKPVADTGSWRGSGARSPEEHAARTNGTTVAKERADLRASEQLAQLPDTRTAATSGRLSPEKTKAVIEGATADPEAEAKLLELATEGDLGDVRDEARRTRQRVDERDGKAAQRMHARRALRMWLEADNEGRGLWNMPPEYQAYVQAALEPYREEAYRIATEAGETWTNDALLADALFMLAKDVITDFNLPAPDHPEGEDAPGPGRQPGTDPGDSVPAASQTKPEAPSLFDPPPGYDDAQPAEAGRPRGDCGAGPSTGPRPVDEKGRAGGVDAPNQSTPDTTGSTGGPAHAEAGTPGATTTGTPDPTTGTRPNATTPSGGHPEGHPSRPSGGHPEGHPSRPHAEGPAPAPDTGSGAPPGGRPHRSPDRPAHRGPRAGNRRAPHQIYIHIDYAALLRGHSIEGETCDIAGIGPVPVTLVKHLMDDCLLHLVLTGNDITLISSDRRYIPAPLLRALEARDPECVVPGCHARHGLEIDHTQDFALGGPTSLDNTARLCKLHHRLKTYQGWTLTRTGTEWEFRPP